MVAKAEQSDYKPNGKLTPQAAGRMGGRRLAENLGPDYSNHLKTIGDRGRKTLLRKDPTFYAIIGSFGGKAVRERYGSDHFANMGRIGGKKIKETRGHEYYVEIGKKTAEARKRKKEEAGRIQETVVYAPTNAS